jgi:hypothetical protein
MGLLGGGGSSRIERWNAIRTNSSILGIIVPLLFGQNRLAARLIDYNDFTVKKTKQQGSAGKGLGKGGTSYVYTASIIGLLAQGPINALKNVWDSTGRFVLRSTSDSVTIAPGGGGGTGGGGGSGGHPPGVPLPQYAFDHGVYASTAYSVGPFTDYGSPGPVTLTGNQNSPYTFVNSVTASDFFAGSALGVNWTINEGTFLETAATCQISGVGADSRACAFWNANTFGATQFARCTIATSVGTGAFGPAVRMSASGETYYGFFHSSTAWTLFKIVAGTITSLATATRTPTVGDVLTLYVTGTSLTAYINGTSVTTQTDSAIASGQPGIAGLNTFSTSNAISGWSAGDTLLASGQYTVNSSTAVYFFSAADAAKTVTVNYSYYRFEIITQELTVVPFSGPFTVTVDNSSNYRSDIGVSYYPSGTALTKVGSSPAVGQYSQSGAVYTFNSADTGQGIVINYVVNDPNQNTNAPTTLNLTLVNGTLGQAALSYMTGKHPSKALGYSQIAYIFSSGLYLGFSPTLPNYSYEVSGNFQFGAGILDANPADCITALLTDPGFGVGFPSNFVGDLTAARTVWTANSFFISPVIENQSACAHLLAPWLEAGMVGAFWSEAQLKFVPYSDTTAVGNGVTYSPSTTPIVNINDNNYILPKDKAEDPVKIIRSAWQDAYNRAQVSYQARVNDYNPEVIYEQDEASIGRFGLRIEDPKQYDFITTLPAAQYAASMRVQRTSYIRNQYSFRLPDTFSYLEPMDVITINDLLLGLSGTSVRINKIEDDPKEGLMVTAEDFIWGIAQPAFNPKAVNSPYLLDVGQQDPGNTNALVFEAPNRLGRFTGNVLYGFVNGSNPNWGGCNVWVSSDGTNYALLTTINTPGRLGTLTQTLAAYSAANPDTINTLQVKLNVIGTTLPSASASDASNLVTLCAIVNASNALELLSYQSSFLAGAELYNLTTLYRGVYGTSGTLHNPGEIFARLDEASFTQQYDPSFYGKTLNFKFTSFNLLGNQEQSLASVTAYPLSITGSGKGTVALDTGFLLIGAPGYTAYRPLTNPLTAHDAGSNATINIASFTMQLAGLTNIAYNSGSITGLSYNTLYYIYFDDPAEIGGTVVYHATTTKETAFAGTNRFFVGSIQTPRAGGPDTIGNGDGGSGAQIGQLNSLSMSIQGAGTGTVGNGTLSSPFNALDGDLTTAATLQVTGNSGSNSAELTLQGVPGINRRYIQALLKVRFDLSTNTLNGLPYTLTSPFQITYDDGKNSIGGVFVTVNTNGTTLPIQTLSAVLPTGINLSQIHVSIICAALSSSTTGTLIAHVYEAWIEATE